jgi:hypothetical protein
VHCSLFGRAVVAALDIQYVFVVQPAALQLEALKLEALQHTSIEGGHGSSYRLTPDFPLHNKF